MTRQVGREDFRAEVLKSPVPVLVYFWGPGCGPCAQMAPIVDEIAAEYADRIRVVSVNLATNPQLGLRYEIMSIPFFGVFEGGELMLTKAGARPKKDLKSMIDKLL